MNVCSLFTVLNTYLLTLKYTGIPLWRYLFWFLTVYYRQMFPIPCNTSWNYVRGRGRGGATGGSGGYDVPPTFAVCTPQGVQCNLRCTPAGYYRLQLAAKVTQFTFGFSTCKFCFLYSLLQQWHWKFDIQSSILNFALQENRKSIKVKICYLFISTCHRNMTPDWRIRTCW